MSKEPRCSLDLTLRQRAAWFALSTGLLMLALWINTFPGPWAALGSAAVGFAGGMVMAMRVAP